MRDLYDRSKLSTLPDALDRAPDTALNHSVHAVACADALLQVAVSANAWQAYDEDMLHALSASSGEPHG